MTKRDRGGWVEPDVTSRLQYIWGMNFTTVVARQINLASVADKEGLPHYLLSLKM